MVTTSRVLLASGLMLVGCGPPPGNTRAERIAALTGDTAAGQVIYLSVCASCHGTTGRGTASGVPLVEPLRDRPAATIIGILIDGVPGTTMGAYGAYTDQQLADLYTYMKTVLAP